MAKKLSYVLCAIAMLSLTPLVSARGVNFAASFNDVHRAFFRIVVNESNWNSAADANGILQVLRRISKSNIGINNTRFIVAASKAAINTFPATDPWALPELSRRYKTNIIPAHLEKQRHNGNSYWTSTLQLDCSEPSHWREANPGISWEGYIQRCNSTMQMTREYLSGTKPNWCRTPTGQPAVPKYWGCELDTRRPAEGKWTMLACNEPGYDCSNYNWLKDPNNTHCARNRFYIP